MASRTETHLSTGSEVEREFDSGLDWFGCDSEGPEPAPSPSQIGRYEIRRELGRGGMGVVYEAWDSRLGRLVALKTVRGGSATRIKRFLQESRLLAHLCHDNIVAVHDAGEVAGVAFIVMDRIEGESLAEKIEAQGPIPPRQAVSWILPVVRALEHVHAAGILHRDVKPGNVLIDQDSTPRLVDFGLARDQVSPRLTLSEDAIGTPAYMAPEVLGRAESDARVDIYGIGVTLYESLTGALPFDAESYPDLIQSILNDEILSVRRLEPKIAPSLESVVLKCLERDPERRYASATELAEDLERYLRGEAVQARPISSVRRWCRRIYRRRAPLFVALALAAVASLATLFAVAQDVRLERVLDRDEALHEVMVDSVLASNARTRLASYDKLLAAYPDEWEALVRRAQCRRRVGWEAAARGDEQGAAAAFREALKDLVRAGRASPAPGVAFLLQGEILRDDLHDPSAAQEAYRSLLQTRLADFGRARLALLDQDLPHALRSADRFLAEHPGCQPGLRLKAEILRALSQARGGPGL